MFNFTTALRANGTQAAFEIDLFGTYDHPPVI